jgi:molecular chaperone DnaK
MNAGIDLGTTYSLVAHVNAHGQPAVFPDAQDASLFRTPSVVYVGAEGCFVGEAAEQLLEDSPQLAAVRFVKARLGDRAWRHRDALGRDWSAEALSALVLRKLLRDARAHSADDVDLAVLTVPAQFNDEQRRATLRAASLAGLGRVRLVEEPVAAASFIGEGEAGERTVLLYDFGGGTFDVTLLHASKGGLRVLATDGISRLGGRDLDQEIARLVAAEFARRHGADPLGDPASAQLLRRAAEQLKIRLARPGVAHARQAVLLLGRPHEVTLMRAEFDALAGAAVARTIECCERCLEAAGLSWAAVDRIALAGGSSQLPQVAAELLRVSGRARSQIVSRQPHQAVAFGAAVLAGRIAAAAGEDGLHAVAGADVCLRVWDRVRQCPSLDMLIARNTPLPTTYRRTFYTNRVDQRRLVLEMVQRRGMPPEESSLGLMAFGPIETPARSHPIEVVVELQSDGLVRVRATDLASGHEMARSFDESGDAGAIGPDQRQLLESVFLHT